MDGCCSPAWMTGNELSYNMKAFSCLHLSAPHLFSNCYYRKRFVLLIYLVVANLPTAWSAEVAPAVNNQSGQALPVSALAKELIEILNLNPAFQKMANLQEKARSLSSSSLDGLAARYQQLAFRQALVETIEVAELDVRAVAARIDSEIADADAVRAVLERKRDRDLLVNLTANFATAGIAKIVGNSLGLAPGGETANHILEIMDGGVQTGLPLLYVRQQYGERRMVNSVPTLLSLVLIPSASPVGECPSSVWRFLNNNPAGVSNRDSRIVWLNEKWRKLGLFERHKKVARKPQVAIAHLAGTVSDRQTVTIDLLEDRSAMLTDLKAMVTQMEIGLRDVLQLMRARFPFEP